MESLTSPSPNGDRRFSLLVVDRFEDVPEKLQTTSRYFGLLTAIDFSGDSPAARDAINRLIIRGLAYFSSWGTRCEALHDLVDRVYIENGHFRQNSSDVLMTVWNSGETLENTLWDFAYASCPSERYIEECQSFVIAAEPQFAERIRRNWTAATLPE